VRSWHWLCLQLSNLTCRSCALEPVAVPQHPAGWIYLGSGYVSSHTRRDRLDYSRLDLQSSQAPTNSEGLKGSTFNFRSTAVVHVAHVLVVILNDIINASFCSYNRQHAQQPATLRQLSLRNVCDEALCMRQNALYELQSAGLYIDKHCITDSTKLNSSAAVICRAAFSSSVDHITNT